MDKIGETQKNPPSGSGTASEGSEETTPKADTKTYTQDELDKAIQKDRIARGRDAKSLELREQAVTEREEANKKQEAEREAAEYEAIKDDPDKLAAYNSAKAERERKRKQDEREAALDKRDAEGAAKIEAAEEALHELALWQTAASHTTDSKEMAALFTRLKDLNIDDKEQLEKVAEAILPKTAETDTKETKVDSGVTSGGGEKSEEQKLKERYPTMK